MVFLLSRNQNSHFSLNPVLDVRRSRFDRSWKHTFTMNAGELVPFFVDEVLPGDTFKVATDKLCRAQTLLTPIMDNMYMDVYYFFVPNRLVWEHWEEFMGENNSDPWTQTVEYSVPQVHNLKNTGGIYDGYPENTIADYMGVPTYVKSDFTFSALPFRAYALIWNEWFRDQNVQSPQHVDTSDSDYRPVEGEIADPDMAISGMYPMPVSRFRDYFSSCLPSPQKGPDVLLPVGGAAPVYSLANQFVPNQSSLGFQSGISLGESSISADGGARPVLVRNGGETYDDRRMIWLDVENPSPIDPLEAVDFIPKNLWADLGNATAASVNELRMAFAMQKLYERDARGGTRYIEILKSHFGVTSPDSRLQRPEYLGGNRVLINVNQVVQSSATTDISPQGTTTAYSLTVDGHDDFTRSFVEHGLILGVCCVRYDHTYQQGLERFWSRKNRFDFYDPLFASIGEQPVLNKEIFLDGTLQDNEVFGYNEAWADYRYKPSRVSGEMRSNARASLDFWHLADDYASLPKLSDSWMREDRSNIDRCLAVSSEVSSQFLCDFQINNLCTRAMPTYSIPGLIDHH